MPVSERPRTPLPPWLVALGEILNLWRTDRHPTSYTGQQVDAFVRPYPERMPELVYELPSRMTRDQGIDAPGINDALPPLKRTGRKL